MILATIVMFLKVPFLYISLRAVMTLVIRFVKFPVNLPIMMI